jgi:hypothetical protein
MIWAKVFFLALEALADLKEQLSALGRGNFAPLAECSIRSLHGALDILGIRRGELPKLVAGVGRIEGLERLARGRVDPLSVNIVLIEHRRASFAWQSLHYTPSGW